MIEGVGFRPDLTFCICKLLPVSFTVLSWHFIFMIVAEMLNVPHSSSRLPPPSPPSRSKGTPIGEISHLTQCFAPCTLFQHFWRNTWTGYHRIILSPHSRLQKQFLHVSISGSTHLLRRALFRFCP